jgi:hypothetical protein
MKLLLCALLASLFSGPALAREGFFREEQLPAFALSPNARKASLFVEELQGGKWKHVGNAFFVHADGYLITNYHIAQTCLRDQRDYFRSRFAKTEKVYKEGFLAASEENLVCGSLRVTDDPASNKRWGVKIAAFPRVGDERGPVWDFAVLKLAGDAKPAGWLDASTTESPKVGDEVFLVGYPYFTERLENSGLMQQGDYEEVKTGDYRVGAGKVLEFREGFFYAAERERFFYTDTDGGMGSSGSALLNASGKLVGLILGSGDQANTASTCIMHYQYCGGVSLYLKASYMRETLTEQFPSLAEKLFR